MPQASKMGGFMDPFVPEPAWPQDTMFIASSSWPGSASSSLADTYLAGAAAADQFHLQTGSPSTGALLNVSAKEMEQFLSAHLPNDVDDSVLTTPPCAISLADSAPVVCSSSNDSSGGSEQSGLRLPPFLLEPEQPQPQPPALWPPSTFPQISSLLGDENETSQNIGFGSAVSATISAQLQVDAEFNAGKMLSFTPGGLGGQQLNASTTNFSDLQLSQKEFSGLHHLNLTGQQLSSFNATGATRNPEQSSEVSSGKIRLNAPPPFMTRQEVANGNGVAGSGAPKPRVRARRGQATDPHSIAERLRREKISDRMKNLQELVPNSNRTDKASMLEEIIEYVKFLQLQVKVLSMSRLGATEAVVPLLTESHTESSGAGLLLSPRSGRQRAGRDSVSSSSSSEARDGAAFEQEVAQLMESNMTTAMQYLQSKGLCLMPIALASAISDQKGASSAAVQPETGSDAMDMLRAVKTLGSPIQGR